MELYLVVVIKEWKSLKILNFLGCQLLAAPYNYPIEIKYAFVGFGTEGDEYPVMDRMVHKRAWSSWWRCVS